MARTRDAERRQQLLRSLIDVYAAGGLGARPLREIADRVGTSHRMLIHHFGSREAMLVAVVEEVERRQATMLGSIEGHPADQVEMLWASVSDPTLRPFERLFFECYARGANGEAPFDQLLPDAVELWLAAAGERRPGADPALGRLGLAVIRGLLLDLVATDDADATTRALARFAEMVRATTDAT